MGRPRKRRRAEMQSPSASDAEDENATATVLVSSAPAADISFAGASVDRRPVDDWSQLFGDTTGSDDIFTDDFAWLNKELWTPEAIESGGGEASVFRNFFSTSNSHLAHTADTCSMLGPLVTGTNSAPSCACARDLFSAIQEIQAAPPNPTLHCSLTVSRKALTAAKASIACSTCPSAWQSAFSANMMLGALLPLLVAFYRRCLESIAATTDGPQKVAIEAGYEVEVDCQVWKCMAHGAVKRDYEELLEVLREMDRLAKNRHPGELENGQWIGGRDPPLCRKIVSTVEEVAGTLFHSGVVL